ncbi:MAG TPA: glycosyltransferase family 39 protein, partial [Chloroflexota bacterium]|nr:glycosyltransferase family 39 protein [Chloroflexota bacterium]
MLTRRLRLAAADIALRLTEWRLVWSLFVVALLLHVLFLETTPNSVTADELDFAGNALAVMTGHGPGLFGLDWMPEPALDLHFIVGSWTLFGETLFAERLVAAVLTALAVLPFYALLRRLVRPPSALLATALFIASRWLLLFARSGWNNGYVVLFLLLGAWSLTLALERTDTRYWLAFGAVLALLLYGYVAGRAVVAAFALYLVGHSVSLWRAGDRTAVRRLATGTALAAMTCVLLCLPEVPTVLQHWQYFNQRFSTVSVFAQPLPAGATPATLIAGNAWTAARSFLFMDPTVNGSSAVFSSHQARYIAPSDSWLDPLTASLYVVGLVLGLRRGALALWWCLLLVPLALTQTLALGAPDGARALPAVAPMYVFVALALDTALHIWATRWRWVWRAAAIAVVLSGVYNVVTYVRWVNSPGAIQARQPGVPVTAFYTWRDFQLARLNADLGVMATSEYDGMRPEVIAAQIAGVAGVSSGSSPAGGTAVVGLPAAPPVNGPPQTDMASQTATIGTPGTAAGDLNQPRDVAIDHLGNIYVADTARKVIVVYAADGTLLREWAPAIAGQPITPWAVVALADGSLYILDSVSGRVGHFDGMGNSLNVVPVLH